MGEMDFFSLKKNAKSKESPPKDNDEKKEKQSEENSFKSLFSLDKSKSQHSGKKGGFGSGWLSTKEKEPATPTDSTKEPEVKNESLPTVENSPGFKSSSDAKIRALVELVSQQKDHTIARQINFDANKVTFPLLAQIGENEDNIAFLERLAGEAISVLEKDIFERLLICPDHPDSLGVSLRLYCTKCSSPNIEKLHLIEHKSCGYIGERTEFEVSSSLKCPMCRNVIRDASKELKIPGMWYECHGCKSKFDNPTMKLYCRGHSHDFNLNQAESITIPCFRLVKEVSPTQIKSLPLIALLKRVLMSKGFTVEENAQVKGASGVSHTVSLFARTPEKTVLVDIRSSETSTDDTEVVSLFVKVVDISPSFAIFVGVPSISDKARAMSAAYSNISIVTGSDFDQIAKSVEEAISKHMPVASPPEKKL